MGIHEGFALTNGQLIDIADDLDGKIREGLEGEDREIKCLPTYVSVSGMPHEGDCYALDLGGSNVRAAVVNAKQGHLGLVAGPVVEHMPWKRNEVFPLQTYLDIQGDLLAALGYTDACPLGYCFSYPTTSTRDGDAALEEWTKGIMVPGVEGKKVGRILLDRISERSLNVQCTGVTVINDTVASLLAGYTGEQSAVFIGLIVGTGTNMACLVDTQNIPKLRDRIDIRGCIPVNLESGNFHPPHLTSWDSIVDKASENPGKQIFEKAVSGAYLGRVYKAVFPDAPFDSESGAEGLVRLLEESKDERDMNTAVALAIYERSARLVAASLAGLIKFLSSSGDHPETVNIVAEGGLFWGTLYEKNHYYETVRNTLDTVLAGIDLSGIRVKFKRFEQANLLGSALAALL